MTPMTRRSVLAGFTALGAVAMAPSVRASASCAPTSNEALVRELYRLAEPPGLDADRFAKLFTADGYFLDVSSGQRWVGSAVKEPAAGLIVAYPDMHRELLKFYESPGGVVVVELKLQGTHLGDLPLPSGVLQATKKKFDVACCDVWQLDGGRVKSFHCYTNLVAYLKD